MPTGLQIERWAPLVVGCGAGAFWVIVDGHIAADIAKELLAALLTAASIAAGFLATSLSIVLTMAGSQTGKQLRDSGYDGHLHRYLREAIYGCLVLAMLSVFGFFFFDSHRGLPNWVSVLIVFAIGFAATALIRIAEILMNLFARVNAER